MRHSRRDIQIPQPHHSFEGGQKHRILADLAIGRTCPDDDAPQPMRRFPAPGPPT